MKRLCTALLILTICGSFISCSPNGDESDEPQYEKIIPETAGIPEGAGIGESPVIDIEPLEAAVRDDPQDPNARFAYMNALQRTGRIMDALEQARALAVIEENNDFQVVAYLNFAKMILDDLPADEPGRAELVDEAMDGLWVALGWEPESIPAHKALGRLALESGDDEKALHHLAIVLSVTEIGYELRTAMAEIYIGMEDIEKARAHLVVAYDLADEAEDIEATRRIQRLLRGLD